MLEKLLVWNFQKHEYREVNFDPFITTFVGKSSSGKSSLLRALRWVLINKPNNDSFISFNQEYSKVKLFLDSHSLVRKRGKSSNLYILDKKKFSSFGTSVPEEISNLVNVGEVNFQRQLDPYWFFALSPGEIAKELNSIINLGLIDKTLFNLSSELRKAKSVVALSEERLTRARVLKEELSWVEQANLDLEKLEKKEAEIDDLSKRASTLEDIVTRLRGASEVRERCKGALEAILGVLERAGSLQKEKERIDSLESLINKIKTNQEKIWNRSQSITRIKSQLSKIKVCPLCERDLLP